MKKPLTALSMTEFEGWDSHSCKVELFQGLFCLIPFLTLSHTGLSKNRSNPNTK